MKVTEELSVLRLRHGQPGGEPEKSERNKNLVMIRVSRNLDPFCEVRRKIGSDYSNKVKSIELSSLLVRVILTVTAALMILRC